MKNKYMDMLREEANLEDDEEDLSEENLIPYDEEASRYASDDLVSVMRRTILLLSVSEAVIVLFFVYGFIDNWKDGKWQALLGLFIGSGYAVFWLYSLKWQMEALIEPEAQHRKGRLKLGAAARIVLLAGLVALACFTGIFNPVLCIIGALNLKLSGYLYPLCKKFLGSKKKHELQS